MAPEKTHAITIIDRSKINVSGVCEVISADSGEVVLDTTCGRVKICGSSLSMGKLDCESGELDFSGKVNTIEYKEVKSKGSGFSRLFR